MEASRAFQLRDLRGAKSDRELQQEAFGRGRQSNGVFYGMAEVLKVTRAQWSGGSVNRATVKAFAAPEISLVERRQAW